MAIDVQIQDESGKALAIYDGPVLGLPFLKLAPANGACLRFVLPWADTTFNSEQVKELRSELLQVLRETGSEQRRREATALLEFVSGIEGAHIYVKFIGD
jgi:hypothetical protein